MLAVGLEVVEGPKISINASFIEVCGFLHRQSHIWCIVCDEGYVGTRMLHTVHMPPLGI
jgi:hypothetical protein